MERTDEELEDDKWCALTQLSERCLNTDVHAMSSTIGELTNVGRQSTYHYGKALRALYISR